MVIPESVILTTNDYDKITDLYVIIFVFTLLVINYILHSHSYLPTSQSTESFCHRLGIEPSNSTPSLTPYFSLSAISRGSCASGGGRAPQDHNGAKKKFQNYIL